MRVMVITDNEPMYNGVRKLVEEEAFGEVQFDFFYSFSNKAFLQRFSGEEFRPINIQEKARSLSGVYDVIISVHCKQLFPSTLTSTVRCINVHPGYNPYNRGWYPQVFSIINKLPVGTTIHEMDEKLDHGKIVVQRLVDIESWETSYDVYVKILGAELELLELYLLDIIYGRYVAQTPTHEGNLNLRKDFEALREISLDKSVTFRQAIDYLRALSFPGYKNAYYYDTDGSKVFVDISFQREKR